MKCVLFDFDGTVADTEALKGKALALAIQKIGGKASAELYKKVMGRNWEAVTAAFFAESGVHATLDTLNPIFREAYARLIESELEENRYIVPFLDFLKSKNIRVGIVSSGSPWMIERGLIKLNLKDSFEIVVTNADTEKHKPHPDAYRIALARLGVNSSETIAFEDSEPGIQAATGAGLSVYGVRHEFNEAHSFAACVKTITSFEECLGWKIFA